MATHGMIALVDIEDQELCSHLRKNLPSAQAFIAEPVCKPLEPFAIGLSNDSESLVFAIEVAEFCGRRYVFAADMGGRVLMYDISDDMLQTLHCQANGGVTCAPPLLDACIASPIPLFFASDEWEAPLNPYDGFYANILDVFYEEKDGAHILWASDARSGIYRMTLTSTCPGPETLLLPTSSADVQFLDTPGVPHYFSKQVTSTGEERLYLADKKTGVRLYTD